jgi:hypothetical protein
MTTRTRILLLLTTLFALTACHGAYYGGGGYYGGGYYGGYHHHGYYNGGVSSTSYGRTGIVYHTPTRGIIVAPAQTAQSVTGSDGTYGWKTPTSNPDNELRRLTESMVRAGCIVDSSNSNEARAQCYGIQTLVRIDSGDAYRLCAANTDQSVCASTWARIGN